jgi:hypothetical protein
MYSQKAKCTFDVNDPKLKSWRMITHLSYPEGRGINDFIDPDLCTVRYTSFDNVVEIKHLSM